MKLSELFDLMRLPRQMRKRPCPVCGTDAGKTLLRYDRYLLPSDVRECTQCGMIYCANMLPPQALELFYVTLYGALMNFKGQDVQIAMHRDVARQRVEKIVGRIGPLDHVLEIGAGYGYFLDAVRASGGHAIYGIEPSAGGVAHAKQVLSLGDQIVQAPLFDAAPPPFGPQVTVLFHVLEHLLDPGAALARLADWIPEGGHLVIEVPDTAADWSSLGLQNFHLSHASYFRAETLMDLLRRCGFRPGAVEREAQGIYPGNLRVFAQRDCSLSADSPAIAPPSLAPHVAALVKPWSIRNGYPRSAVRLLRLLTRR